MEYGPYTRYENEAVPSDMGGESNVYSPSKTKRSTPSTAAPPARIKEDLR